MITYISLLISGLAAGAAIVYLTNRKKTTELSNLNNALSNDLAISSEKIRLATDELIQVRLQLDKERIQSNEKSVYNATLISENRHLLEQNQQKLKEVDELQKKLTSEFENIANRVLHSRTQEFREQQNIKLSELILPFKEKLQSFEKKVEETYDKELRDKLNLRSEVQRLYELNQKISTEANNLTRALKGDVKKMGNWGELILERVLEQSD
jgi:DNA recombination protein RmuC